MTYPDNTLFKKSKIFHVVMSGGETMTKFVDMGVEELYEIGSGSVLSNLAKRSCHSFKRMSAGSKESVENLLLEFDS